MTNEEKKPIVQYKGKWWMLEKIKNDMAVIWRNGEPALVPAAEIKEQKNSL